MTCHEIGKEIDEIDAEMARQQAIVNMAEERMEDLTERRLKMLNLLHETWMRENRQP